MMQGHKLHVLLCQITWNQSAIAQIASCLSIQRESCYTYAFTALRSLANPLLLLVCKQDRALQTLPFLLRTTTTSIAG